MWSKEAQFGPAFFKLVILIRFDCEVLSRLSSIGNICNCRIQVSMPSVGLLQKLFTIWTTMAFRSRETLNFIICSGIWGSTRHLSLKITKSLAIFRLRKPLKTSTRLVGHGIWTRDLPNASLVRYHGATSLGDPAFVGHVVERDYLVI